MAKQQLCDLSLPRVAHHTRGPGWRWSLSTWNRVASWSVAHVIHPNKLTVTVTVTVNMTMFLCLVERRYCEHETQPWMHTEKTKVSESSEIWVVVKLTRGDAGYGYGYGYERAYFTNKDMCPNQ